MENENLLNGLPKLIEEEAQDAMKYAHLALEHRADHPDFADLFMELSGQELKHMQMISGMMTAMIDKLHAQYKGE